ncbi:MAG TPA: BON domain-containing protein [Caulobacteraceae bacterium]|nr:BON domain-containing protein [Caulobacteraceae bacterium]
MNQTPDRSTPHAAAGALETAVAKALDGVPELANQAIHARVEGGRIALEGSVDCDRDRRLAERAVWAVPGVREVENHLRTVRPEPAA